MRRQAEDQGVDTEGDKDDLISRIAMTKRKAEEDEEDEEEDRKTGKNGKKGGKMMKIMDASSSSSSSSFSSTQKKESNAIMIRGKQKVSCDSLPSNLHSLSAPQLRSVCAANGLLHLLPKNASKSEILYIIESEVYDGGKREKQKEEESDDASVASDDGGSDVEFIK